MKQERLAEAGGELSSTVGMETRRQSLIVCAAFVQNPVNLGGLCRTAEAFHIQSLVVADLAVTQTPAFRKLAASAQRWQPMSACPIAEVPHWLRAPQQAGYCRVALQATPTAQSLFHYRFPARTILILGQELTGVPADILALCDQTIAIPQSGQVESLNVQVAAAIALYEYTRQHQK